MASVLAGSTGPVLSASALRAGPAHTELRTSNGKSRLVMSRAGSTGSRQDTPRNSRRLSGQAWLGAGRTKPRHDRLRKGRSSSKPATPSTNSSKLSLAAPVADNGNPALRQLLKSKELPSLDTSTTDSTAPALAMLQGNKAESGRAHPCSNDKELNWAVPRTDRDRPDQLTARKGDGKPRLTARNTGNTESAHKEPRKGRERPKLQTPRANKKESAWQLPRTNRLNPERAQDLKNIGKPG